MITKLISSINAFSSFFVTPLPRNNLKNVKFYIIYSFIIIPAVIATYYSIDKQHQRYTRYSNMNDRIIYVSNKKKQQLSDYKEHYLEFVRITKQDDCLSLLSNKKVVEKTSSGNITNKAWNECVNEYTINERINDFISKNYLITKLFYSPINVFKNLSQLTKNTIGKTIAYTSSKIIESEKGNGFPTIPVKIRFNTSFSNAIAFVKKLSNACSNCKFHIHKITKTSLNNNYDFTLIIRINTFLSSRSSTEKLSAMISSGVFSGENLSNYSKENPKPYNILKSKL